MEVMLVQLGILAILVGVISIIWPPKFLTIPTRDMGGLVVLAGVVLFGVGASTTDSMPSRTAPDVDFANLFPVLTEVDGLRVTARNAQSNNSRRQEQLRASIQEQYERFGHRMIEAGMPAHMEPHNFAALCLALSQADDRIDPVTDHVMSAIWIIRHILATPLSSPDERTVALLRHIASKLRYNDTWPKETADKCIALAPIAGDTMNTADRISVEIMGREFLNSSSLSSARARDSSEAENL